MKKYLDSKKGIYTDGYNHYVVDLSVYPFLTDSATIDNADELLDIFKKAHAHGGQLTAVYTDSNGNITERAISMLVVATTKALGLLVNAASTVDGAVTIYATCAYLTGTWTVGVSTATTAWDT